MEARKHRVVIFIDKDNHLVDTLASDEVDVYILDEDEMPGDNLPDGGGEPNCCMIQVAESSEVAYDFPVVIDHLCEEEDSEMFGCLRRSARW